MYLIKKIYTPTEKNPNFKDKQVWFCGKNGMTEQARFVDVCDNNFANVSTYFLNTYGYERLCDAKRKLKSEQELADFETKQGNWNIEVSISEF